MSASPTAGDGKGPGKKGAGTESDLLGNWQEEKAGARAPTEM